METTFTASANGAVWLLVPQNAFIGLILGIVFLYFIFRHLLFVLMVMDLILGWLRKYDWFPKEGKRRKTLLHWLLALAVLVGFLMIARFAGLIVLVPQ